MVVDVAIEEGINVSHNLGGTCFYRLPIPKVRPHPHIKKGIMLSGQDIYYITRNRYLCLYYKVDIPYIKDKTCH